MFFKNKQKKSTVWMNVTSSTIWDRPPVGIIRVEQLLCRHLKELYAPRDFKQCAWQGDRFIECELSLKGWPLSILKTNENSTPQSGDVLISVGLDWDAPYADSLYNLTKKKGIILITCIYDLIPILLPQFTVNDVAKRFQQYINNMLWAANGILCISKQTEHDLFSVCDTQMLPKPLTQVMYLGDHVPEAVDDSISDAVHKLASEKFILYVSTIERRKNHETLYRAYHLLCKRGHKNKLPKMVWVGMPGWGVSDLFRDIEMDPLTQGKIITLDNISDAELNHLYAKADFCVYSSLYEGWGLPVAEALALGKAVISSDEGSLPEVGHDLVRYVSSWDPYKWADAILDWVDNPEKVKEAELKIQHDYKRREWSDTAKTVQQFITNLQANEDINANRQITLNPGYDCKTIVGVHIGPYIKSTGQEGYLLYGPYIPLRSGKYKIEIYDDPSIRTAGEITIDMVTDRGKNTLWDKTFDVPDINTHANSSTEIILHDFEVQLKEDAQDFEIRCYIRNSNLYIKKIEIIPMRD